MQQPLLCDNTIPQVVAESSLDSVVELKMVRVSSDEFLAKVASLYGADAADPATRKATIAISCKSLPAKRVDVALNDDPVLLFRAVRYGNNHHKRKFSAVVTAKNHGAFHSQLGQILKTQGNASSKKHHPSRGGKQQAV
ncbi:hypothetical protein PINS_up012981 [Pythium insidiosum]|nr:hypothetical protein PINS_up012981 [Pythium insidiosum]